MRRLTAAIVGLAFTLGTLVSLSSSSAQTAEETRLQAVQNCLDQRSSAKRKVRCVRRAMEGWAAPAPSPSPTVSVSPTPALSPSPSSSPIPPPTSGDTSGKELRFSIFCNPAHVAQVDPLVSPGTSSAHLHQFFGNRGVTQDRESPEAMRTRGTTCEFSGDTAGYWIPILFDRNGDVVPLAHVLVYYRHSTNRTGGVAPHPPDFGEVSSDVVFMCRTGDTYPSPPDCSGRNSHPDGAGMRVVFPARKLPTGQWTPHVALNVRWQRQDIRGAFFHTSVAPHGDFWNVWDQDAFATLVNRCLNPNGVWRSYTTAEWDRRCSKVDDAAFAIGD